MKKYLHYAYIVFMVITLTFIITSFWDTPIQPGNVGRETIEPVSVNHLSENEREFIFDIKNREMGMNDLSFYAKHQYATIYADDTILYKYEDQGGIWGHTPGAYWVFVDVPEETSNVKVVFRAAYDVVKSDVPEFFIGNELASYREVFRNSISSFLISILILVFGLVLMIYWKLVNYRFGGEKSLLYLGQFTATIGLYLVLETDAVTITVPYRVACVTTTYVLLMMLVPSGICFFKEFLGTVEDVLWRLICVGNGLWVVISILLQISGMIDMREILVVTHVFIIVALLYTIVTMVVKLIRKEISTALKVCMAAFGIITLSSISNIALFYQDSSKANTSVISMLGFMFFILILSVQAMKNSLDLIEMSRKMEIYKELAITDLLTGLNNRNSYMNDIHMMEDYTDIMIVTFDLNNLKECNDNMGHEEGDNYLLSAANMINETFKKYGICYRIGGDEFCVLVKNASSCPVTELLDQLEDKMEEWNQHPGAFPMYISYGYAIFDKEKDADIEETRDRSDVLMYQHKRQSKQTNN